MIATPFVYESPRSIDDALSLLSGDGRSDVLAGGTWVVPELSRGLRRPATVVDLRRVGLSFVRRDVSSVVIGATTSYSDLAASGTVRDRLPALAELAAGITGGMQLRNRGTIGGAACYARPASDVPAALVGLDARLRIRSTSADREVDAADFFLDAHRTLLRRGELLTEIVVPDSPERDRMAYYKFKLCSSSWPIATAFCSVRSDNAVHRLVVGGVCSTPVRVDDTAGVDAATSAEIPALVEHALGEPWSDALADGGYRQAIAGVIAARAARAAAGAVALDGRT